MTVGEKIKVYLDEHGIKYNFIAEKIGIEPPAFSKVLRGTQNIDCVQYYIICKTLAVPMETFFQE